MLGQLLIHAGDESGFVAKRAPASRAASGPERPLRPAAAARARPAATPGDPGFTFRSRKGGSVEVLHQGRLAATLRGSAAQEFLLEVAGCEYSDAQQLMARLTGNYKRGNERAASNHHRNRR